MSEYKARLYSPKLARREGFHNVPTMTHWCPACDETHDFACETPFTNGAKWMWDGNAEKPTFSPSMNIRTGPHPEGSSRAGEMDICHYFLNAGRIQYLGDCTHAMANQMVDLPDLPVRDVGYGKRMLGSTLIE